MDKPLFFDRVNRREFVVNSFSTIAASALFFSSGSTLAGAPEVIQSMTVQQVIDRILKATSVGAVEKTVDTLKAGNPDQLVTGIVSTMFATVDVIRKAIDLKANFIIAHEPTFYGHLDETEWLETDKVFQFKKRLLDENKIAVWRFHDYLHRNNPDGVRMGVVTALEWNSYYDDKNERVVNLPPTSLKDIIAHVKNKLKIEQVRIIGDPSQMCKRILLMPGASGGKSHIQNLQRSEADLLICGEVAEWETSEYMRDARAMGEKRSLIVLGHAQSEEPGMQWLVTWLEPKIEGIKVTHVPSNNPFSWA